MDMEITVRSLLLLQPNKVVASDTIVSDFNIPFVEYGLLSFTVKDVWMATSFTTTYYCGLKLPYNPVGAMYKLSTFPSFNFYPPDVNDRIIV